MVLTPDLGKQRTYFNTWWVCVPKRRVWQTYIQTFNMQGTQNEIINQAVRPLPCVYKCDLHLWQVSHCEWTNLNLLVRYMTPPSHVRTHFINLAIFIPESPAGHYYGVLSTFHHLSGVSDSYIHHDLHYRPCLHWKLMLRLRSLNMPYLPAGCLDICRCFPYTGVQGPWSWGVVIGQWKQQASPKY